MKKYLLFTLSLLGASSAYALSAGDVTVTGKVIVNEMHTSTLGKVASIWFLDGTTQTTADTGGPGGSGLDVTIAQWNTHVTTGDAVNVHQNSTMTALSVSTSALKIDAWTAINSTNAAARIHSSTSQVKLHEINLATGTAFGNFSVFITTTQDVIKSTTSNLADSVNNAVNDLDNPVSWNALKDVPAGFADGSDDGAGGSGLDVTIAQWNTHTTTSGLVNEHQNSTITAIIVSTTALQARIQTINITTGTAFGNFSVFITTTQDVIKSTTSNLADSVNNAVNDLDNPVSWNSLKDVPAGFADGDDASGGAGGGSGAPGLAIWRNASAPVRVSSPTAHIIFDTNSFTVNGSGPGPSTATITISSNIRTGMIQATLSGGGSTMVAFSSEALTSASYDGIISSVTILGNRAGEVRVNIKKFRYADWPGPGSGATSICAAACPSISGTSVKNHDSVLTGWDKSFNTGDYFLFHLDTGAATMTSAVVQLHTIRK